MIDAGVSKWNIAENQSGGKATVESCEERLATREGRQTATELAQNAAHFVADTRFSFHHGDGPAS